jgi:hypothetical protein
VKISLTVFENTILIDLCTQLYKAIIFYFTILAGICGYDLLVVLVYHIFITPIQITFAMIKKISYALIVYYSY